MYVGGARSTFCMPATSVCADCRLQAAGCCIRACRIRLTATTIVSKTAYLVPGLHHQRRGLVTWPDSKNRREIAGPSRRELRWRAARVEELKSERPGLEQGAVRADGPGRSDPPDDTREWMFVAGSPSLLSQNGGVSSVEGGEEGERMETGQALETG